MFTHRVSIAGAEACGAQHATVTEALDCMVEIQNMVWDAEQVYCSLCDGLGHAGGCPLENRGVEDTYAEEAWEAARGVVSFEEAWELASI